MEIDHTAGKEVMTETTEVEETVEIDTIKIEMIGTTLGEIKAGADMNIQLQGDNQRRG